MDTLTFIDEYEGAAVRDAVKSGVPASITMAQAIIEGAHGNSMLFQVANNTFGIKCGGGWKGPSVRANDDTANECFRKYESIEESFADHSKFLKENSRYDFLFDLGRYDYEGWAHGLKKAGYATAPNYAQALIKTINEFKLTRLDRKVRFRRFFKFYALPGIIILVVVITLIVYYRSRQYSKAKLKLT